jgi:hypothetical protein
VVRRGALYAGLERGRGSVGLAVALGVEFVAVRPVLVLGLAVLGGVLAFREGAQIAVAVGVLGVVVVLVRVQAEALGVDEVVVAEVVRQTKRHRVAVRDGHLACRLEHGQVEVLVHVELEAEVERAGSGRLRAGLLMRGEVWVVGGCWLRVAVRRVWARGRGPCDGWGMGQGEVPCP